MSKVPIQLLLNGEERAEFVDSGITLLKFLRDKISERPDVGTGSCYHHRQLRRIALQRRSGTGHEVGHRADLRRDARRAHRACDHRHGGIPISVRTLHGDVRLPRYASHRQRRDRCRKRPAPDGPYGAKALARCVRMCPIANAVFDAVGVRVDSLPLTRNLRALQAKEGTQAAEA